MQSTSMNMQRKPGFPVANCSIKMPDAPGLAISEASMYEEDSEQQQRRLQLINFGHAQWGFNNWNWAVTKQELDFVELSNGKHCAGVVAFVSVTVKSLDIHRENIGYATSNANNKGFAIYKSRKCAVTNALRETLLSFGGSVATELMELLETGKSELPAPTPAPVSLLPPVSLAPSLPAPVPVAPPEPAQENNQNVANKPAESRNPMSMIANAIKPSRKEEPAYPRAGVKAAARSPPVARAHPMPGGPRAPLVAPRPAAPVARAPSNDGKLEGMTEEEARAERKRRQRMAQEEFRLKQLMKSDTDDKEELTKNSSGFDLLLLDIPTQDIVIQETGDSIQARGDCKRKSPQLEGNSAKKRAGVSKLDIVHTN